MFGNCKSISEIRFLGGRFLESVDFDSLIDTWKIWTRDFDCRRFQNSRVRFLEVWATKLASAEFLPAKYVEFKLSSQSQSLRDFSWLGANGFTICSLKSLHFWMIHLLSWSANFGTSRGEGSFVDLIYQTTTYEGAIHNPRANISVFDA